MSLFIRVTVVTHDGKLVTSYTMDYDDSLHRKTLRIESGPHSQPVN